MKKQIALATKHGKLAQIQPAFERLPDFELLLAEIDTDSFGTFSGEVPRTLSPLDTAVLKARAGATELGVDFGLASEGTIGPNPSIPWATVDQELIALVWLSQNLIVYETHQSTEILAKSQSLKPDTDLSEIVRTFDLPNHAVNLCYSNAESRGIQKGIRDPQQLLELVDSFFAAGYRLELESDFRAMSSPSRQANIAACAAKLVARLASNCPSCQAMGWGKLSYEFGVPCVSCGEVNSRIPHTERLGCVACDYFEPRSLGVANIDPSRCDGCNP